MWHGRKPDLRHLRVFGSKAYAVVPKQKQTKLGPRGTEMTFVGYSLEHKAYRLVNPITGALTISRDVIFLEDVNFQEELLLPKQDDRILPKDSVVPIKDIQHLENRRSERTTKGIPPVRYEEAAHLVEVKEPRTVTEALAGPEKDQWKSAMDEEYHSLVENGTWVLDYLPEGRKAIGSKWVFKIKRNEAGVPVRFKARLVGQGFSQKFGTDYDQVFAPVAKQVTFRVLLTIASRRNLLVKHVDIKTAYLYGKLDEQQIYMRQPEGYHNGQQDQFCLLKRSLYGLKQSGRVWNKVIDDFFKKRGLVQLSSDACLYKGFFAGGEIFILLYVDDMIIACEKEEQYRHFVGELEKTYKISSLGNLKMYLGIEVTRLEDGHFKLSQSAYIEEMGRKFNLSESRPSNIPMDPGYLQVKEEEPLENNVLYQSLVGALLYVAVNTRADISIAVSMLGRKVSQPTNADWTEAKRVLRYLLTTRNYGLHLGKTKEVLKVFVDADWAGDQRDRKSNSGFAIFFGSGLVNWGARKQKCVALSSTEAEFIAVAESTQEILWQIKMMTDFGESMGKIQLFEDNQSAIKQLYSEKLEKRSKHVDTKYEFIKDVIQNGLIEVSYCPTEEMIADILTKPLQRQKLETFRDKLGIKM
jgi:hypothetical protein